MSTFFTHGKRVATYELLKKLFEIGPYPGEDSLPGSFMRVWMNTVGCLFTPEQRNDPPNFDATLASAIANSTPLPATMWTSIIDFMVTCPRTVEVAALSLADASATSCQNLLSRLVVSPEGQTPEQWQAQAGTANRDLHIQASARFVYLRFVEVARVRARQGAEGASESAMEGILRAL